MRKTIRVGDTVRMTKAYRDTLADRDEARRESRRQYIVAAIRGTIVDFTPSRFGSSAALSWVERVEK